MTETGGSSNPEVPQEVAESEAKAQDLYTKEPPFLIQPLQSISPIGVTQDPKANPAQLPKEGAKIKLKK